MKVLIDVSRMHSWSRGRGIGVYVKNLYEGLKEVSKERSEFRVDFHQEGRVDYSRYDLIHLPFFDLYFNTLPYRLVGKAVVTVHDVIPLRFKKYYPPGIRGQVRFIWQKYKLKKVKGIITDSVTSKKDIVKYLGVEPGKIYPVYLAGRSFDEKMDLEKVKQKYGLERGYLLYVGDVNLHKNVVGLVRSLVYLPKKMRLVLVGSGFDHDSVEKEEITRLIQRLKLGKRVKILGRVSDKELGVLYQMADFYVQPSLWEGFGLPVLEALSLGVPVVVSRGSSLREITCDEVAFYIKYPFNGKKIAEAIRVAYQHKDKVDKNKLKAYAKKFSWQETARQTYKVYRQVLGK